MNELNETEQAKIITRYNPELELTQDSLGGWNWSFRRVSSKIIVGDEYVFDSPLEALAHYAAFKTNEADKMIWKKNVPIWED